MSRICPICKTNKLILGGMVAKDGAFCGKCFSKFMDKGISNTKNKTLKELSLIYAEIDNSTDIKQLKQNVEKLKEKNEEYEQELIPIVKDFKEAYSKFFLSPHNTENSALQNSTTQFLWHMLFLKKLRLDSKQITMDSKIEHLPLQYTANYIGDTSFDGKYEIGTLKETVGGKILYTKNNKILHSDNNFNICNFRTINAKQTGHNAIICPACGSKTTRSNLIDGCDYCKNKFTVEDLGLRISEYKLDSSIDVESTKLLNSGKTVKAYTKKSKSGKIIFLIVFGFSLILMLTGALPFNVQNLLAAIVLSAIVCGIWKIFDGLFGKPLKYFSTIGTGSSQASQKFMDEEKRLSKNYFDEIKKIDPLFSVEGFYSEVQNMISAIHYASSHKQVTAFFEGEIKNRIPSIIENYSDVYDISVENIFISNFTELEKLLQINLTAHIRLLKEDKELTTKKMETINLTVIKNKNCKTQTICAPAFLTCPNCGGPLSLMEGAECAYCGTARQLSQSGWAITEYSIS